MIQKITSANTSINCTKLPAIYNKINFSKFRNGFNILDYGCGKFNNSKNYITSIGGNWWGYDPFNRTEEENMLCYGNYYDCIICSNVLNVISDTLIIYDIIKQIFNKTTLRKQAIFVTVYEGDKSGMGKITKKDCYQRNESLTNYVKYFNTIFCTNDFVIKKGVITNHPEYIK